MGRITFTADEQHEDIIGTVEQEKDTDSTSEAVRKCIEGYADARDEIQALEHKISELQETVSDREQAIADLKSTHQEELSAVEDEYEAKIEQLETEIDRLNNRNQMILEQREENTELVKYVQDERTFEQRWRQAGIVKKAKWRVFGMPEDDADDSDGDEGIETE